MSRCLCPGASKVLSPFLLGIVSSALLAAAPRAACQEGSGLFIRGDANVDGETNIADAVYMLGCNFLGTECPSCADAGDTNDDGESNVTDPIALLNYLFASGAPPPPPLDVCGPDETADLLECASFARCADPDSIPTSRGDLLVRPVEHASLVLLWDGKAIYVDPVGGAALYAGFPRPDIILVTDIHGDHMDGATLRGVAAEWTTLVLPRAVSDSLAGAGGTGAAEVKIIANGETAVASGIGIEAIPMYNLTPDRLRYHEKGRGNGYVIDLEGTRVYVSGDTEDIPEMRMLTGIDLAFICMNLPFTMTAQQAASAVLEFAPKVVYPYHSRGQNTDQFRSLVEDGSDSIEVRLRNWYPES